MILGKRFFKISKSGFSGFIFVFLLVAMMQLFFASKVQAQCMAEILTPTQDTTICLGDSVYLSSFASCSFLMNNTFNNGTIGNGWSSNASPMYNNPCGAGMPGSGVHCWIGSATNFPRELVTIPFNLFNGCSIEWEMRYAADENATDCEDPDQPDEGVHLQYSIPPYSSWIDINYWTPNSTYTGPLYSWGAFQESIPAAAFGAATKIRWYQNLTSGNTWDHWGIDEVQIVCPQSQNIFWSNGVTNTLDQWVSPTTTTEYIVAIFDTLGNLATDTIVVTVIPSPSADFTVESPVCVTQNATITYDSTVNAGVTYTWNFDGGTVSSGSGAGPYEVNWPATGNYTVTLTASEGSCTNTETRTIIVNSDIIVNVNATSPSVCPDSSVTLSATGGAYYIWSPAGSLSNDSGAVVIATPQAQTTYTVTGTSIEGCTGSSSVTINIYPEPQISVTPMPSEGCEPVIVDFTASVTPGASQYLWNFGDPASGIYNTSNNAAPYHVFVIPGSYDVTLDVVSTDGCPGQATYTDLVTVYAMPEAAFMAEPSVVNLSTPTVTFTDLSTGADQWLWNFGEVYSPYNNSTLQNPTHDYTATGEYIVWLIASNGPGCSDTAWTTIEVIQDIAFWIPNSFSPYNQDGVNDYFLPAGIGVATQPNSYSFRIFNRWGQEVFETTNIETGWDGRFNQDWALPGVYSYYIEIQFGDGLWHRFQGELTLYH